MKYLFKRIILAILALSYIAPVQAMSLKQWIKNGFSSIKTSISNASTKTKIFAGLGAAATTGIIAYFLYTKYWNSKNQPPAKEIPIPALTKQALAQDQVFAPKFLTEETRSIIFAQDRFNTAIQSTISVNIATDTIGSIKEKLRMEQSIDGNVRIKLLFKNQELTDQKKLADYKIQNEDRLFFVLQAPESVDNNKLYINTLGGTTYTISIDSPEESVADIQEKIQKASKISQGRQYLIYNKQILDHTKTLAQCGISHGSRLHLIIRQYDERNMHLIQIFIKKRNGSTISIDCYPHTTIRRIKNIIMTKEGIPYDHQRIVWGDRELDDHRTVEDYNLHRENASHLVVRTPKIIQEEKEKKEAAHDEKTLQEHKQKNEPKSSSFNSSAAIQQPHNNKTRELQDIQEKIRFLQNEQHQWYAAKSAYSAIKTLNEQHETLAWDKFQARFYPQLQNMRSHLERGTQQELLKKFEELGFDRIEPNSEDFWNACTSLYFLLDEFNNKADEYLATIARVIKKLQDQINS